MIMAKKTEKDATLTQEQGVVYLSSLGGVYQPSTIDGIRIAKIRRNIYWADTINKLEQLIFQVKPAIKVLNPEEQKDERTTKLEKSFRKMLKAPDVQFWGKIPVSWKDAAEWGGSVFNPVWKNEGNEYVLKKLRHLQSESFILQPYSRPIVYSDVLKGIVPGPDDTIEFYQTINAIDASVLSPSAIKNLQTKLENIFFVKQPTSEGVAGTPLLLPMVPIISMLDFTWQAQIQKVNRIGAPILFLKITNPQGDDIAYGQKFLQNWGKNTSYQLRPNFELIIPDLKDNSSALDTIDALAKLCIRFQTPASMISKDGTLIGGSSKPELEMVYNYVRTQHEWLSDAWDPLLQVKLDAEGYEGYTVSLDWPTPSIDKSDLYISLIEKGFNTRTLSLNERRNLAKMAGAKVEELDDAGRLALEEEYAKVPAATPNPDFQKAATLAKIASANQLDPFAVIPKKAQQKFYQATLGIECGEE
jgi:hypothetical protein